MRLLNLTPESVAENFLSKEWRALDGRIPDKIIDEFIKEITCPFMGEDFAKAVFDYDQTKAAQFIAKLKFALRDDAKENVDLFLKIVECALFGKTEVDNKGELVKTYWFEPF
jgi:hypothetical protein